MGVELMLGNLLFLFFLLMSLLPMFKQKQINAARHRLLAAIQRKRGSRVITMIHRQEALSLLGIPIARYIDIEDSERILRAIRLTPDDVPIDIVLHTPGGLVLAAEQIALALRGHPAKVTVFVPHYAMSGGTLLALAADEIVMDENAVLGPVDPQLGSFPAASILKVLREKDINQVDDQTLILGDVAGKALVQVHKFVKGLLRDRMEEEKAAEIALALTEGRWTHDYPLHARQLQDLGINVSVGLPREIYMLMDLYPQPVPRRPSVQYVPLPRDRGRGVEQD
mgnify:CR=1 FL=1